MNSVKWPRSPCVHVAKWIECPLVFGRSWVWFPLGTHIFFCLTLSNFVPVAQWIAHSPFVPVAQWIECPPVFGRSWVWFPLGTRIFFCLTLSICSRSSVDRVPTGVMSRLPLVEVIGLIPVGDSEFFFFFLLFLSHACAMLILSDLN